MNQAQLIDGRMVDTSSEDWRHECEARAIMALHSTQMRREFLEAIERKRGKEAADKLRHTIGLMWEAARK